MALCYTDMAASAMFAVAFIDDLLHPQAVDPHTAEPSETGAPLLNEGSKTGGGMKITRLDLDGAVLIEGVRHGDARGWFEETWSAPRLAEAGFTHAFVQDNVSFTADAGTLRGLHCQTAPFAQGKLVGVLAGAVRDVIVDIRPGSPTHGRHVQVDLSADRPVRVYAPAGFLHGFVTLRPQTLVQYKVTAPYARAHERSIAWDDPDLAIDWGVDTPVLSAKDAAAPRLTDAGPLFEEPTQ